MTKAWPDRILDGFQLINPHIDQMTHLFYDCLFQRAPEVRSLFVADMEKQRQHFAASLALIVRNLRFLDAIEQSLRELGRHHARNGVRPQHYAVVRDAMLFALAQTLGEAWTDQMSDDWGRLLDVISRKMLIGAEEGPTAID